MQVIDAATIALISSAAPAAKDVVVTLLKAIKSGDEASARAATEAALRLVFEARQAVPRGK
jgi:hypothetical protein